jgi:hypothetical protein
MTQKMSFCFTNISAKIVLHILGYSFCAECHILLPFLPNVVASKCIKNYPCKSCSALAPTNVGKFDP